MAILSVESLSKSFGGVQALQDVTFCVETGHICGLIGPNGAGKTTLFNLITGFYAPDSGAVHYRGRTLQGLPSHRIVGLGITRTFQNVELFSSMSVLGNVMVGRHVRTRCGFFRAILKTRGARAEEAETRNAALELIRFAGLKGDPEAPAADLPFGWQRLLEIARALASEPSLLLLDEPAAGLNAVETAALGDLITKIRDRGVTVLLVEHDMSLTMRVSDRVVVLDQGRLLAQGAPREIQSDPEVMAAYLGRPKEAGNA